MPMTVRLVHGTAPRGLKSPSHFVPELRLLSTFEEEHIFALPLQKEANAVTALPLAAPLKLLRTRNEEQLKNMMEFSRLVEKCTRLSGDVADRIQVLDGKLGDSKRSSLSQQSPPKAGYLLRRSISSDSANQRVRSHHHRSRDENRIPSYSSEYDEIDQIYDYVRGFAPLPKNIRSPFSEPIPNETIIGTPNIDPTVRPEPPPIETIPTKKLQAEKRNRKTATSTIRENLPIIEKSSPPNLPKLYIKNGQSQRSRLLRQKSSSPMKETPPSPISKSGSPIFNIRYKSLTNLQQAMELDGTLDSSHSGGRNSGDSGGVCSKQPEKRSRRISRPRSLTNLVWEIRPADIPPPPIIEKHNRKPDLPVNYKKSVSNKYAIVNGASKRNGTLYL